MREWAREEKLESYDQEAGQGYLRHFVYREGRNIGQILTLLVTAPGQRFEPGISWTSCAASRRCGRCTWPSRHARRTHDLPSRLLWGDDAIEEELLGACGFASARVLFFQTNTDMRRASTARA